jgi:hypothetical protein
MRLPGLLLLSSIFVAACGGNVVVDGTAPGAGGATLGGSPTTGTSPTTTGFMTVTGSSGTGGVSSGGSAGEGGGAEACIPGGGPTTFPEAFRACTGANDCTTEPIVDCCTVYAVGLGQSQISAFLAYEAACENLPKCNCTSPAIADDGQMGPYDIMCQSGRCVTQHEP